MSKLRERTTSAGYSSCDSDTDSSNDFVFYKDREEWADVEPVPQDDGPSPVVQIAYSAKFKDVYDYFRAVLQRDERSERAYHLTTDAAALNPANYTVWHFRRLIISALDKDVKEELRHTNEVVKSHPKNYQIWHHRKCLIMKLGAPLDELKLSTDVLSMDAKNYHAWQYRQWIITTFQLWEGELSYVNALLDEDILNNSAWNQRYFVVSTHLKFTDNIIDKEMNFTLECIRKLCDNESAWNYLRGVLDQYESPMSTYPSLSDTLDELYKKDPKSTQLLSFMVEFNEDKLENDHAPGEKQNILQEAINFCSQLSVEIDTIREEYWKYISRSLTAKYGNAEVMEIPA